MIKPVLILNGPNLNMLGKRQPEIYGADTLEDVERNCANKAHALGLVADFRQSNSESELVDWIQDAVESASAIIINAGGYTHTSVAILDALNIFEGPVIELHISNIYKREKFRHFSFIAERADDAVVGKGIKGYEMALEKAAKLLK